MHKSGNKTGTSNISTFYWQSVHAEKSDKIWISDIFGKYSKQEISCKFDFSELKYHVPRNLSFECLKMKEI